MTKIELRAAQRLREKGLSFQRIGAELGVSGTTIRRWLKNPIVVPAAGRKHPHQVEASFSGDTLYDAGLCNKIHTPGSEERERVHAGYFAPERKRSTWSRLAEWWTNVRRNFATIDEEVNLG